MNHYRKNGKGKYIWTDEKHRTSETKEEALLLATSERAFLVADRVTGLDIIAIFYVKKLKRTNLIRRSAGFPRYLYRATVQEVKNDTLVPIFFVSLFFFEKRRSHFRRASLEDISACLGTWVSLPGPRGHHTKNRGRKQEERKARNRTNTNYIYKASHNIS